jgi:serine/threonine protein kinase
VRVEPLRSADPAELGGIFLRGRLGWGGMGIVYFGVSPEGEQVAVKTIREEHLDKSEALDRFEREILAIGMVQGPRVATLISASPPEDSPPWFVSEYVRGLTLAEYINEYGPLPADLACALGLGLAEALDAIHEAEILHRDLKPSNILLARDGPKVIDFGLAAVMADRGDLTRSSQPIGTPLCMAPEQVNSAKDATTATDVYALGAVLLFALTGHYPYQRPTGTAMLVAIADPAVEPDTAGLPAPLMPLVTSMLGFAQAARPTLPDVSAVLVKALADAGSTDPGDALLRLADRTYVERASDPPPADPPRPHRPRMPANPDVPASLVLQMADDLRRDYDRSARF